jgi:UDP-glucuronate 4-epimerase
MNIFLTGAAGFIGSSLADRLLAMDYHVTAVDNFDPFYDKKIKVNNIKQARDHDNFHFFSEDILNNNALDRLFSQNDFEIVVHIAAKAGVRPSILDPNAYYQTNVMGTMNLLELCKKYNIKKFILASTSSIYGNNDKVPFSEDDVVDYPISPYAASKKAAELLCHTYYHLYGIQTHCLRFFTVYGPRQRPDLAIHKFFKLITAGDPITIFGDGSTSRDYTFIDDILDGVIKSIEKVSGYEIINLGESQTITLNNLINLIEEVLGITAKKKSIPMQPGDVDRTFADITKAKKLLGYNPQTDMRDGLLKFREWFEKQKI